MCLKTSSLFLINGIINSGNCTARGITNRYSGGMEVTGEIQKLLAAAELNRYCDRPKGVAPLKHREVFAQTIDN